VLGLDDLAGLTTQERTARGPELRAQLGAVLEGMARDRAVADLVAAGVPVAPVLAPQEAVHADVFVQRGVSGADGDGGVTLAHPVRVTPWAGGSASRSAAEAGDG
jgi:crotonobetainyl-CoA:carnitine CoA-transferase CaiB-like acyl-CoA transferase